MFRGFVLTVLEYCFAVWYPAADIHLELLDRAVSGASFLTVGMFECDIPHRRSAAVLCMLYSPMHPLYGALPSPNVSVRVTPSTLVAYLYTYTVQNLAVPHNLYSPLTLPVERSCIRWCGTGEFQEQGQCFSIGLCMLLYPFLSSTIVPFLFILSIGWYCAAGVFGLIGCRSLSLSLAPTTSFNNNNN